MYIQFTFKEGNPYVAMTNKRFFEMICKYDVEQTLSNIFYVIGEREKVKTYEDKKALLRDFAIEWQNRFPDLIYSWVDVDNCQDFFEEYGRKFGLLREFRENGLC